jgi:hypothetical protein
MAHHDYSEEDDFYSQGFERKGVASIWIGLSGLDGDTEADVLQDLCGVGYYDIDAQDANNYDFEMVELEKLLGPISYSTSFLKEALREARQMDVVSARWVVVQFDFEYDPKKIRRPISHDPVFLGVFPYVMGSPRAADA